MIKEEGHYVSLFWLYLYLANSIDAQFQNDFNDIICLVKE
jgi:hypothetical protein